MKAAFPPPEARGTDEIQLHPEQVPRRTPFVDGTCPPWRYCRTRRRAPVSLGVDARPCSRAGRALTPDLE